MVLRSSIEFTSFCLCESEGDFVDVVLAKMTSKMYHSIWFVLNYLYGYLMHYMVHIVYIECLEWSRRCWICLR